LGHSGNFLEKIQNFSKNFPEKFSKKSENIFLKIQEIFSPNLLLNFVKVGMEIVLL